MQNDTGALRERIKHALREYPRLYKIAKSIGRIPVHFLSIIERLRYYTAIFSRKTYFGSVLAAKQGSRERALAMRGLLGREMSKATNEYKILEVGSWAGQSAILWASVCEEKNKGMIFCVDHWAATENSPQSMKDATKNNKIFKLFLHNIEASGLQKRVVPLKGSSNTIAQILAPVFNFIYIDGDHGYTQFKKDLANYLPLVKDDGIVCGDDLELQPHEVDGEYAAARKEDDCILDPKSKKWFHPGINVAIGEMFGGVSAKEGFWAMRRSGNGWKSVDLQ